MLSFANIAASLALVLPVGGAAALASDKTAPSVEQRLSQTAKHSGEGADRSSDKKPIRAGREFSFEAFLQTMRTNQIRVRQRVFVRITPRSNSANRRNLMAQMPQDAQITRYKERKSSECVPVKRITSVQTGSGNRLLLFMRDSKVMSVNLEKACRARDFYAGFYVDKNEDGKMCVARDTLQSRNGAKCGIERIMQLVEVED